MGSTRRRTFSAWMPVFLIASLAAFAGEPAQPERFSPKDGHPSLGPAGAATTLIFYTDYQCPVCHRAAGSLDQLVLDFKGDLRVEVRHNPLMMHKNAFDAAAAAKAAQRQGKFWEYHAALLGSPGLDRDSLIKLAATTGLDPKAFAHDFDDKALRDEVASESNEAQAAGAGATPGFVVNGKTFVGWASLPYLEQKIRESTPPAAG